jgi:hypothetical protein
MLHDLCTALGSAEECPLDLRGSVIHADVEAAHEESMGELLWELPENYHVSEDVLMGHCGWIVPEAPVVAWTLSRDA